VLGKDLDEVRVLLEIAGLWCGKSDDGDEPVGVQDAQKDAIEDGVSTVVANSDASDRGEENISAFDGRGLDLVEEVEGANLGDVFGVRIESSVHRTHVRDEDVNAVVAGFASEALSEVDEERLGGRIEHVGRRREESSRRRSEDEATTQLLVDHELHEVMSDAHMADRVRLQILQVRCDLRLDESTHYQVSSVVEHHLHINIRRSSNDFGHVVLTVLVIACAQIYAYRAELLLGVLSTQISRSGLQEIVIQSANHQVQALLGQLFADGTAQALATA